MSLHSKVSGLVNACLLCSFTFSSARAGAQVPPSPPPATTPAPAPASPAPPPPLTPGGCFPACREGYTCAAGQCVSACNPPCPAGQRCTAAATCEAVRTAPAPAPAPAAAPPLPTPAGAAPAPAPAAGAPPNAAPQQSVPAPGTVPLRIEGAYDKRFQVSVTSTQTAHCMAPCTLHVAPGRAGVLVTGDAEFQQDIDVPNSGATFRIETRSNGRVVAGLVLGGIGGVISIYLLATQKDSSEITVEEAESNLYMAIGGLALTVTGVILVATAGSNKIRRDVARADRSLPRAPSVALWGAPVSGGGVAGGLLTF